MVTAQKSEPVYAMVQLDLGNPELIRAEVLAREEAVFLGTEVALVRVAINDRPRWAVIVEVCK